MYLKVREIETGKMMQNYRLVSMSDTHTYRERDKLRRFSGVTEILSLLKHSFVHLDSDLKSHL